MASLIGTTSNAVIKLRCEEITITASDSVACDGYYTGLIMTPGCNYSVFVDVRVAYAR